MEVNANSITEHSQGDRSGRTKEGHINNVIPKSPEDAKNNKPCFQNSLPYNCTETVVKLSHQLLILMRYYVTINF